MKDTKVLWFTGLSGSGKTTIADKLKERLEKKGKNIKIIDGDNIRTTLNKHLGFSVEDITKNNGIILELCKIEIGKVDFILVPIISPFRKSREKARKELKENFIEVYVNCSYAKCEERDVKGLYNRVKKGAIKNFIGLHVPYEKPINPDIEVKTSGEKIEESVDKIINFLNKLEF